MDFYDFVPISFRSANDKHAQFLALLLQETKVFLKLIFIYKGHRLKLNQT